MASSRPLTSFDMSMAASPSVVSYLSMRKAPRRSSILATKTPAIVEHIVDRIDGTMMPVMSTASIEARTAMTPRGSTATPEVLMARNSAIELVATPGRSLSLLSSIIALRPNGVAALVSPIMFAAMFMIIAAIAGWSDGTSGNSRLMIGDRKREIVRMKPASSSTRITPSQRGHLSDQGDGEAHGGLGRVGARFRDRTHRAGERSGDRRAPDQQEEDPVEHVSLLPHLA